MKKMILVCSIMFALVATSFAQNVQATADPVEQKQKGRDKMRPHHKRNGGEHAADKLGLNDEQKAKMKSTTGEFHGRMKAIKTDQTLTKEQKRAKTKELAQAHDAEMKKTLTPEQYTKFSEMKKQRMAQAKNHKGKRTKGEDGHKPANEMKKDDQPAPKN